MSFTITFNNENRIFNKKVKLLELTNGNKEIIACKVNNFLRPLEYEVYYDAKIEFLTLKDSDAIALYRTSLLFLFLYAAHLVLPKTKFKLSFNISRSFYAETTNGGSINTDIVNKIDLKMKELVKKDYPLERTIVSNKEAEKIYRSYELYDKIEILKYRPEKTVHFYNCNGYKNYLFSHMVPSTGYISKYKLRSYYPGILISYPRSETNGEIPEFSSEPNFSKSLNYTRRWCEKVNLDLVSSINDKVLTPTANELINLCEDRHYRDLAHLGDIIEKNISTTRLICVAGPSSSGKTTFANRLADELKSRGYNPIRISLDDYYLERNSIPKDENGETDFEHIDALNKDLFNKNMLELLEGKEAQIPVFDFKKNKVVKYRNLKIGPTDPVIIEGIHALNEQMTSSIPKENKFKVYIAPQIQINLDNENPISMTDARLLRRIVRDYKYRNASAEDTLAMWSSVRKGEFTWIYQTQEDADFVFDSFLPYEPCVLKQFALPLLKKITPESIYYSDAQRLIKFLKYFKTIEIKYIPCNSLLCEFIGGSSYN